MELQHPEGKGVYKDMDQWTEIRKKILVEGVSKRQVMEEEGIHWETLKKILANSAASGLPDEPGAAPAKDRALPGPDQANPGGRQARPQKTAPHGQAHLRAPAKPKMDTPAAIPR